MENKSLTCHTTSERRLIDANLLVSDLAHSPDYSAAVFQKIAKIVHDSPTVDAVVLPCEVGTQIWLTKWRCSGMRWLKLIEPKPRTIHHFDITKDGVFAHFKDGYVNVIDFGETVFLTKEEAKAALAKMDGGNDQ